LIQVNRLFGPSETLSFRSGVMQTHTNSLDNQISLKFNGSSFRQGMRPDGKVKPHQAQRVNSNCWYISTVAAE